MAVALDEDEMHRFGKDPFKHAAYADTIEDIGLKTSHYLHAIHLYKGCISDWHLKYLNGLMSMRQHKIAYHHIALYYKNVRGLDNSLLIKAANYQFRRKHHFLACKLYEKVNNNMIWKKRLNHKLAICYKETGELNESIKYFKRHLRQQAEDRSSIQTYIHLANVYSKKTKYKKALDIYTNKLTKAHIERHALFTKIARCYFHLNDFEMSLFYLNKELKDGTLDTNRNTALYYKGVILSRKCQMYPNALKCFQSMSVKRFKSMDNELGFVYFRLKQFDLSLKHYQAYTQNNDTDSWFALRNMAMIHKQRGNLRRALQLYQQLHRMISKSKRLSKSEKEDLKMNALNLPLLCGDCCYSLGQYKAALKHLLTAHKAKKPSSFVLPKIAYIYHYKLHKYKKAHKYYHQLDALGEMGQNDMEFHYTDCLQKLSKYQDAFEMMKKYLAKYPDSVRCLNKLVTLNMIGALKCDHDCDVWIHKALSIDANALDTNYIYAFHSNMVRNDPSNIGWNNTQLLADDRRQNECCAIDICIDISRLYSLIDVECVGEMSLFIDIGLNYFHRILVRFPDDSVLNISYAHFLAKCKQLELLDAFHTKLMCQHRLCGNFKYICQRIRAYAVVLEESGRVDFAIELMKSIDNNNINKCFVFHLNLGILYSIKKDYNESLLCFQNCLELNAMDFEANVNYANVLFKLGMMTEAAVHFKRAFGPNAKKKKYDNLEFLIHYVNVLCTIEGYSTCIAELCRMLLCDLNGSFAAVIHRIIVEIHAKCNYNWNYSEALRHLKVIYEWKATQGTFNDNTYCDLI